MEGGNQPISHSFIVKQTRGIKAITETSLDTLIEKAHTALRNEAEPHFPNPHSPLRRSRIRLVSRFGCVGRCPSLEGQGPSTAEGSGPATEARPTQPTTTEGTREATEGVEPRRGWTPLGTRLRHHEGGTVPKGLTRHCEA